MVFRLQDLRGRAFKRRFACGSNVQRFHLCFFFRSASEKNETQEEGKVPLRMISYSTA
jgi:hypothetical protein